MQSPLLGRTQSPTVTANTTTYLAFGSLASVATIEAAVAEVLADSYTAQNFQVLLTTAPTGSGSWTFTVQKNGADTGLTCTITGAATTGSSPAGTTVTYAAGDTISVKAVSGATAPSASPVVFGVEMLGVGQPIVSGGQASITNSANNFLPFQAGTVSTTSPSPASVCPTGGTIDQLYLRCRVALTTTMTLKAELYKNGTATGLTATLTSATGTQTSDLTHSVAVAAGDKLHWQLTPTATPTAQAYKVGCRFRPTVDGESIQTLSGTATNSATAANYWSAVGAGAAQVVTATETSHYDLLPGTYTFRNLRAEAGVTPTGTATWTVTVRSNLGPTTLTCTITNAGATAFDTTHQPASSTNAPLSVLVQGANTPAVAALGFGFVTFKAPTSLPVPPRSQRNSLLRR